MNRLAFAAIAIAFAAQASAFNLISDGGFELGDSSSPQFTGGPWSTQYTYATNNNANANDLGSIWHEGNLRVMQQANNGTTGHSSWNPVTANEGSFFLAVNGATQTNPSPFVLTQVFANNGAAALSISLASVNLYAPGGLAGATVLEVFLDGVSLGTTNTLADNVWRTASFTGNVLSGGPNSTLRIVANTSQASGNDFGLDNIQVTQVVPEPFTMGLGIAAAGAFVRRRLKAKTA
jgi:hypothetical protein